MEWGFEWTSTLRNVVLGAATLGVVGGMLGSFTFLRRQSLLGDALAHAALPGVCVAFLLTGSKESWILFFGALVSGVIGALLVLAIVRGSKVKEDSAIGIVLSVFFGFGVVLLTRIQKLPEGNQSGLDTYLFGQAATLLAADVRWMAVVGGITLLTLALLYKEFKLLSFDRDFGASLGFPVRLLDVVITTLLVVVVVIGLQTVGVVLMIATLITPAAAARQWTERLGVMILLAGFIGGACGVGGAVFSAGRYALPTGPAIVLSSSCVLVVSLLLAPRRGLLWAWVRERTLRGRVQRENLLKDLYRVGEDGADWSLPVSLTVLRGQRGLWKRRGQSVLRALARRGWVQGGEGGWRLTSAGLAEAEHIVRKHRLWELYLTRRLDLPSDHVHRDAEGMEHALSDEAVSDLEELLGHPRLDPHGRPIPRRREVAP